MKLSQVAAQLHTVREHCATPAGLAATAKKIRALGYTAIELSGTAAFAANDVAAIARDAGLAICAELQPPAEILARPEACIARLRQLGCRFAVYPWPEGVDFANAAQRHALIRQLDAAGATFRAAGLTLAYHNHALEFVKLAGATFLDELFASTVPQNLAAELDTFWIHYGGGDVVAWCEKLRGRLPLLHVKDYGFTAENSHTWCEVGAGTLDWPAIVAAAERSGCEWFIVEQDTCPGDPFDSLRASFEFVATHLAAR
ncbi:MAG TPA: sugar phosphate isomerase/epimerase [Opitutaceae bacterium]|nr:sugar phosphate isomerase/epimerase [Opitutaceae bacterium]